MAEISPTQFTSGGGTITSDPTAGAASGSQPHGDSNPTFAGQVVRGIARGALSTLLSIPAGVEGPKGITVHTGPYLGDVSDLATEIKQNSEDLAQKINSGQISLARGLVSSVANSALTTANATLPFEGAAGLADAVLPATAEEATTQAAPTLAQKGTQFLYNTVKGAAAGYGYDVAGNIANTQNKTAGQILKPGAGTVIGAVAPAALETTGAALDTAKSALTPTSTVDARIQDATPSYNKSMTSENVMTPDGSIVPRINAEGSGITGTRPVTSSAADVKAGQELANIQGYPDSGTALQKSLSAKLALSDEAENMRSGLQAEDTEKPLDTKTETTKVKGLVLSNLPDSIQTLIERSPKGDISIESGGTSGDPLKDSIQKYLEEEQDDQPKFPKTPAGRYYAKLWTALKNFDGSREGILDLRQAADDAYDSNGGKYTRGSDSQAELSETHRDIRNALNKELASVTENTDTQASLAKQTNLYHGIDVLNDKAAQEAPSALSRFMQRNPIARIANRMLLRRAIGQVL